MITSRGFDGYMQTSAAVRLRTSALRNRVEDQVEIVVCLMRSEGAVGTRGGNVRGGWRTQLFSPRENTRVARSDESGSLPYRRATSIPSSTKRYNAIEKQARAHRCEGASPWKAQTNGIKMLGGQIE